MFNRTWVFVNLMSYHWCDVTESLYLNHLYCHSWSFYYFHDDQSTHLMSITMEAMLMIWTLVFQFIFSFWNILLLRFFFVQIFLLLWREDGRAYPEEAVKQDLSTADQAKTHAEAEQTSGVSNVRRLGDLFVLLEPLGVRILDEDVEHDQVFFGVLQDDIFDWTRGWRAVWNVLTWNVPVVVLAKVFLIKPGRRINMQVSPYEWNVPIGFFKLVIRNIWFIWFQSHPWIVLFYLVNPWLYTKADSCTIVCKICFVLLK